MFMVGWGGFLRFSPPGAALQGHSDRERPVFLGRRTAGSHRPVNRTTLPKIIGATDNSLKRFLPLLAFCFVLGEKRLQVFKGGDDHFYGFFVSTFVRVVRHHRESPLPSPESLERRVAGLRLVGVGSPAKRGTPRQARNLRLSPPTPFPRHILT